MQKYGKLIDTISEVLNSRYRTKEDKELFKECLRELKNEYKTEISTKFLKSLIQIDLQGRTKANFIYYFLKNMGLQTERKIRNFSLWNNQISKTDVIDYAIGKNGQILVRDCHEQEIGKFVKQFYKEVLYFVRGF